MTYNLNNLDYLSTEQTLIQFENENVHQYLNEKSKKKKHLKIV